MTEEQFKKCWSCRYLKKIQHDLNSTPYFPCTHPNLGSYGRAYAYVVRVNSELCGFEHRWFEKKLN